MIPEFSEQNCWVRLLFTRATPVSVSLTGRTWGWTLVSSWLLLGADLLAMEPKSGALRARRALPSLSGSSVELELSETPHAVTRLGAGEANCSPVPLPSTCEILDALCRDLSGHPPVVVDRELVGPATTAVGGPARASSPVRLRQLQSYIDRYRGAKKPFPKHKPYDSSFAIYAAHTNQPAALELLAQVEDLTQADAIGRTPLLEAARHGHVATIEKLHTLGVRATSAALAVAVEHGQLRAVRALLAQGVVRGTPELVARAHVRGHTELAELLAAR